MATPVPSGINKVGDSHYQSITTSNPDGSVGTTLYRVNPDGSGRVPIYDVDKPAGTGELVKSFDANATAEEKKLLSDPNSQLSQVRSQQITKSNPFGDNPTAEQKATLNSAAGKPNQAGDTKEGDQPKATPEDTKAFGEEANSFKDGTRTAYEDVRYPENLKLEHQDCIKFSILEYRPSLAKGSSGGSSPSVSRIVEVVNGVPQIGKKPLGTITLPIPAGINDGNSVSWQEDPINALQKEFGEIANSFIQGGPAAAAGSVDSTKKSFSEFTKSGDAQTGLSGLLAGLAVGSNNLQQRTTGTIFNNNLELLFNGPSLRSFSFTFKMAPRSASEAKNVMKIIRFFKQAMAVKRSKSSLLLKTPHTFAISYLTSNKQHPYLNKFKECALTSFNVDYTPEGQYMTYMGENINERSMISYQISLTFQELEPIFDDEYGNESPQNILNVGY